MQTLNLARRGERLTILCLGAHSDDIEIGAGGTILSLVSADVELVVHWYVASAVGIRESEALSSAQAFLQGAAVTDVRIGAFRDAYLPHQVSELKDWLVYSPGIAPDLIFPPRHDGAHQDHSFLGTLTWQCFRDSLILEYEIPKWDGDLGQPNFYFPLHPEIIARKIELLEDNFESQRSRDWFDSETFRSLARLRGIECRAPGRYAEAFHVRKAIWTI